MLESDLANLGLIYLSVISGVAEGYLVPETGQGPSVCKVDSQAL